MLVEAVQWVIFTEAGTYVAVAYFDVTDGRERRECMGAVMKGYERPNRNAVVAMKHAIASVS